MIWWPRRKPNNDAERIADLEEQVKSLTRAYHDKAMKLGMAKTDESTMKAQREIIVNQRIELHRLGKIRSLDETRMRLLNESRDRAWTRLRELGETVMP